MRPPRSANRTERTVEAIKRADSLDRRLAEMTGFVQFLLDAFGRVPPEVLDGCLTPEDRSHLEAAKKMVVKQRSYAAVLASATTRTLQKRKGIPAYTCPYGFRWKALDPTTSPFTARELHPDPEARRWGKLIVRYQDAGWNNHQIWVLFCERKVPHWVQTIGKGRRDVGWMSHVAIARVAEKERELQKREVADREEDDGAGEGERV